MPPLPKPPGTASGAAARQKNKNLRVVTAETTNQPPLPESGFPTADGPMDWPDITVNWWEMWGRSPLSREFTENDWSELMDTAVLHAQYWSGLGGLKVSSELRQRVAKFGATPEDRLRLRIQFATADKAEAERPNEMSSARARRRGLGA